MVRGGGLRRAEDRRSRSGRPTTDAPRPRAGPGGPGAAGGAGGFRSGTAPGPGDGPRPGAVRTVRDGDARRVVAATPEAGPEGADPPEHPHAGPACGPERGRGAPRPAGVRARAPPSGNLRARRGPAVRREGPQAWSARARVRRRTPSFSASAGRAVAADARPGRAGHARLRPPRRRRPVRHGVAGPAATASPACPARRTWPPARRPAGAAGEAAGRCRRRHRAEEFPAFPRPTGKAAGVPRAPGSARSRTTTRRTPAAGRSLARRPHWHAHFPPTGAGRLDQAGRFFAGITDGCVRRGAFANAPQPERSGRGFPTRHDADTILGRVARPCQRINGTGH